MTTPNFYFYDEANDYQRRAAYETVLTDLNRKCSAALTLTPAEHALAKLLAKPGHVEVEIRPVRAGEEYFYDEKWRVATADGVKDAVVKVRAL